MMAFQRAQACRLQKIIRNIRGTRQRKTEPPNTFGMRLDRAANGLFGIHFTTHRINRSLCVFVFAWGRARLV